MTIREALIQAYVQAFRSYAIPATAMQAIDAIAAMAEDEELFGQVVLGRWIYALRHAAARLDQPLEAHQEPQDGA